LHVASDVVRDGEFYTPAGLTDVTVRDRSDTTSTTIRRPKMLPPAEIRKALTAIVQVHLGVARDEAITEAARLFGFKTTSAQLRKVIEPEVQWLLNEGIFQERIGKLYAETAVRTQGNAVPRRPIVSSVSYRR
jgi:hypothetical protein